MLCVCVREYRVQVCFDLNTLVALYVSDPPGIQPWSYGERTRDEHEMETFAEEK